MKKILLTMLGVALIAAPVSAQRVDVAKLRAAIAKSDTEIADAKKAAKAAAWLTRGQVFLDAEQQPVANIYVGMPLNVLELSYGTTAPTQETVGGQEYSVYTYQHAKAYVTNGMVEFFVPVTVIDPAALDKSYDAFAKAYELDAKSAKKVGDGMNSIHTRSFENGGAFYSLGDFKAASVNFRRAYRASSHPASAAIDTLALFYAGMTARYAEDFTTSLEDLDKAISMGYEAGGDIYSLKFQDLYNLDRREESLEALTTGITRFPGNEELLDMIMRYYAENDGDPTSLIPMVQDAINKNPNNPNLYQGLARVYDKLGQIDNAIDAAKKAVSLAPNDFASNYIEGLFTIKKGDEMVVELSQQSITSPTQYQQALSLVNDAFRSAIAPLERAYAANPSEPSTVELLKSVTFRLREEPGMTEKYEKYNALLQ